MDRRHRLISSTDFKRVRRKGRSYAHPLVVLSTRPSGMPETRFGITVSRSLGGAVRRNRARRRLRETVRSLLPRVRGGYDVVLVARPALAEATASALQDAVLDLFHRAGLLEG
jgi:ribonuclease P protein component